MAGNLKAASTSDATQDLEVKDLIKIYDVQRHERDQAQTEMNMAEHDIVKAMVNLGMTNCLKLNWTILRSRFQ